jgi:hypothetical protein
MSDADSGKPPFDKGDRAAIVRGAKNVGIRGSVFWVGENKFGPGWRFGLRGDDGATYWVDEQDIGREEDAPPAPPPKPKPEGPTFERGDEVKIISGSDGVGETGQVFWAGESKYSDQMRYGVRVGEESYWVDANQVEAAGPSGQPGDGQAPPPPEEGAAPAEGDLPPEAFEEGGDMPPEAYEDDIPF